MDKDLSRLLARYMEGETTQEEQRLLAKYLMETDPLPEELKPYRQMFDLIGERPEVPSAKALERFGHATRQPAPSPLPLWGSASLSPKLPNSAGLKPAPKGGAGRGLPLVLAAACLAAFAFILHSLPEQEESLAVAHIDGKELHDQRLALQMGQQALQEIFSNGNQEEQLSELFNNP